jgi:hypothetical protein
MQVRLMYFTWTLSNGLIQAVEGMEAAVAAAVCGPGASAGPIAWERGDYWGWLKVHTAWLGPLVPLLTNQYLWLNWRRVFTQTVPAALRSRAGEQQGAAGQCLDGVWEANECLLGVLFSLSL